MSDTTGSRSDTRARIVDAAAALLSESGQSAVTTRGVAERAGVQAPTIYRLFGDKDGLLDAVAEHAMTRFAAAKAVAVAAAATEDVDPVDDLRAGWDMTIDFGLANPDLYVIMSDPARGQGSPATQAGVRILADRVRRVARAGRLRTAEDRAVELIHAAGTGAVLAILARPPAERDRGIADDMLAAVLGQILTVDVDARPRETSHLVERAVALRAHAEDAHPLSPGERVLLAEWLDRIVRGS